MKNKIPSSAAKRFLLLLAIQCCCMLVIAQVRISGQVTASNGNGLAGISVVIKNTTYGASTDPSGNYSFSANLSPGTYTLTISGIGFKTSEQSLNVGTDNAYTVNAQLAEDPVGLDEVVVTGAAQGTTRRQLGNTIHSVKGDQLTRGATANVLSALQGKTPGAQITQNSGDPAGGISVRLRGISSVFGASDPLFIVDGIIVNNATNRVTNTSGNYDGARFVGTIGQNRLADLNPADIERIEVLNGAAAAAIYGSRANAGVIQIFTKRGSSGAPVVSFSTSVLVNQLRKKLDMNMAPVKFGPSPDVQTQDIITPALVTTTPVTRYDYQDYIFRTGFGTDNNISVAGGKDRTKYYVSGSYFYNQGIIKNTDFRRFSFRANLDQSLNDILSFNIGLNYINSGGDEKPDGNAFFSPTNGITILGNFHDIFTRDALGNLKAVGERGRVNPVSIIEDFKQRQETSRLLANIGIKLRPWKGVSFDYTMGIDNYSQNGNTFIPPFAYNVSTGFYGGGATLDPTLNGYASTASNAFFQINHDINGTYQFNLTDNIGSTTQVGYSVQYEKNNYSLLQGRGLAPFVQTVNGASTALPPVDSRTELSVAGAYLQQSFRFNNQFFLSGAVRVDGSSVFGEDQRTQTYLKASGSYVLSESNFWQSFGGKWWNLFKLRAAYGQSGNLTGIGAYDRFNSYTTNSYLGRTALYSSPQLANENVRPERQEELEIGTDLAFFNNRLGLQFTWYNKQVKDLLIDRIIAPTTGFSTKLDNFGALENKGIELMLNIVPISSRNVRWDATFIFNRNRNKAVEVGDAATLLSTNAGAPVAIIEGYPIGVFYGTFFATDASGNRLKNSAGLLQIERGIQNSTLEYTPLRDATGMPPTSATTLRKIIGDPNPDYTASFINELNIKRLSIRVQFDAVQGGDVFNADFRTRQGVGNGKVAEQEHLGLLPRGWVNNVYAIEEWRVQDGSFVKLREVSVSYRVGTVARIRDITLSLSGRNLISWDDYDGYDPEVNAAGQSTVLRGIDFGSTPIPRTFSFTVAAKF
ncbi:MAG TPA: SusC/RagA family TonB-linked outer membrane protein [Chitinophagaceae bacterium]|nr:SusC/RagA family TonB-linked outer membrane protein [Chitinophagaceae bacterium]